MTLAFRQRLRIKAHTSARETFWEHYDRESYECPCCGYDAQGIDREFDVHHIDGDWLNGHIFNLVGLCFRCHKRVHRIRNRTAGLEAWKRGFGALGERDWSPHKSDVPSQRAAADGGDSR